MCTKTTRKTLIKAHQRPLVTCNLHSKDLNGVAINNQLSVLGLHCAFEQAVGGVILEQVGL